MQNLWMGVCDPPVCDVRGEVGKDSAEFLESVLYVVEAFLKALNCGFFALLKCLLGFADSSSTFLEE
jgi:hypothetical protein